MRQKYSALQPFRAFAIEIPGHTWADRKLSVSIRGIRSKK
jgi:hypothetical protein